MAAFLLAVAALSLAMTNNGDVVIIAAHEI